MALSLIVGIVGGGYVMFSLNRSLTEGSDVGDLPELASVQATLRPLDICRIEYMMRTVGANQDKSERVRISPCRSEMFPPTLYLSVPPTFPQRNMRFSIHRSSRSDEFTISVDKSRVAFGDLVTALTVLAPDVAARYPAARAAQDAADRAAQEQLQKNEAERARAQQRSRESYPTR